MAVKVIVWGAHLSRGGSLAMLESTEFASLRRLFFGVRESMRGALP